MFLWIHVSQVSTSVIIICNIFYNFLNWTVFPLYIKLKTTHIFEGKKKKKKEAPNWSPFVLFSAAILNHLKRFPVQVLVPSEVSENMWNYHFLHTSWHGRLLKRLQHFSDFFFWKYIIQDLTIKNGNKWEYLVSI